MPKDTFYFSHDYHARNDEKILELRVKYGAEGYGLFWMLVETMAENENGGAKASLLGGLSLGYGVAKERLKEFVDFCIKIELFYEDGGFIFSRRMKKHKDFRQELSKKGKEGAEKRWKNSPPNTPPMATPMQRKEKEIKEKEIQLPSVLDEKTIVGKMKAIWLKRNPRYQIEDDNDCPALLNLAYKIAKVKGWEQKDVVNGKLEQTAEIWDAVTGFIRKDDFYKKLALPTIDKQWTGLVQSMAAAKEKNRQQSNTPVQRIKSQSEIDAAAEAWLNED